MSSPTIIVMGVCGAGKTLIGRMLAERQQAVFDDADDFHLTENRIKLATGIPLTDEDRRPWYALLRQRIVDVRASGRRHVMACSALHRSLRAWLRGEDSEGALHFVLLESPRDVIENRVKQREGHFMSPTLIGSQFATLDVTPDILRVSNDGEAQNAVQSILKLIP